MTGIDEIEGSSSLERYIEKEKPTDHGEYAVIRLRAAEIFEDLCDSKLKALDALARLENSLWASSLLEQPDAELARRAFGLGLTEFCRDLK